jgi:mRNA-degrading endonuclease RelE of RelBE toxin-antitoxin system
MPRSKRSFELVYDSQVARHLARIERKYHSLIRRAIEKQLSYEPEVETRNRKPLRQPTELGTTWEIRFGPNSRFRVFYETVRANHEVYILAIGVKVGNRLFVGEEEFEL